MPDISEELTTIASNKYGENVRMAIISALDKINQAMESDGIAIAATLDRIEQMIENL